MILKQLHIRAFGCFRDRDLFFSKGINLIEGENESGKSTVAAFLKFLFFGLSKTAAKGELSELAHYIPFDSDFAAGSLTLEKDGVEYRVEREVRLGGRGGKITSRRAAAETVNIVETATGKTLEEDPAAYFLGVPEEVYAKSAFVSQRGARPGGSELQSAIENILFSADETTNTQKALKRLEDARIQLLHKNEKGGKIYDLRIEAESLEQRLSEAKYRGRQLEELEEKYESQKTVYETNKEKLKETKKQLGITEAYRRLRQIDAARRAEETYRAAVSAEEEFLRMQRGGEPPFLPDAAYLEALTRLESEYLYTEKQFSAALQTAENDPEFGEANTPDLPSGGGERVLSDYEKTSAKAKTFTLLFGILLCLSAVACGFAFLCLLSKVFASVGLLCAVGALLFLCPALLLLHKSRVLRRECREILVLWKAASVKELEEELEKAERREKKRLLYLAGKEERQRQQRACRLRMQELLDGAAKLAARWGRTCESGEALESLLEAVRGVLTEQQALHHKTEKKLAQKEATAVQATAEEERNLRLLLESGGEELVGEAYDTCKKNLRFYQQTTEMMSRKLTEMERQCAELRLTGEVPADLAARLHTVREEEAKLKKLHDAYRLAYEKLSEASAHLRERVAPALTESASALMAAASDGKYRELLVDESVTLRFVSDGVTRECGYLSGGSAELAYLCLRLALVKLLYADTKPTLLFDESFAELDDRRAHAWLRALQASMEREDAPTEQILLFTSQKRERALLTAVFGESGFAKQSLPTPETRPCANKFVENVSEF